MRVSWAESDMNTIYKLGRTVKKSVFGLLFFLVCIPHCNKPKDLKCRLSHLLSGAGEITQRLRAALPEVLSSIPSNQWWLISLVGQSLTQMRGIQDHLAVHF